MQDVKLVDIGSYYDFSLDVNGDIETEDSFDATLIVSLFTDARADANEVPVPEDRRGWIGNLGYPYQIGSKLWLLSQSRITSETAQRVRSVVQDALRHYVDNGLAKSVDVTAEATEDSIAFSVTINRYSSKVDTRYFELWNNTGK